MTPLESSIVRSILAALNALPYTRALKYHGTAYGRAGHPDIYGCTRGRAFFLEVKRPGGKLTSLQGLELERWHNAGAIAAVVHSREEALAALEVE